MKAINRWKHWDSLSDKNKKKDFFIIYTIIFAITAFAATVLVLELKDKRKKKS